MRPDEMDGTVLHVNDCAMTAEQMIAEARRRGMTWDYMSLAATHGRVWRTPRDKIEKAIRGGYWLARLTAKSVRHEFTHVHSAGTMGHARFVLSRFILHCHGTDVRTLQYTARWRSIVLGALRRAEAVFYPTPELHEHVLQHRPDAIYLPIPIDPSLLPLWKARSLESAAPRIFFASRWAEDKGGDAQLEMARRLIRLLGRHADIMGLDWGASANEAQRAGVRLLPKMDRPSFLQCMADADVVIGQSAGILATSELEALGIGVPLVIPVDTPSYTDGGYPPPVYGHSLNEAVDAVCDLAAGTLRHDPSSGRAYIDNYHHVSRAVDTVISTYRQVRSNRHS